MSEQTHHTHTKNPKNNIPATPPIPMIKTVREIREQVVAWQQAGLTIGFVPTMGALHAGHFSLLYAAKEACDKVIVSIFVNPKQFGPNEDLDSYPRPLEQDHASLTELGADILYAPTAREMYPDGFATHVQVPRLDGFLCGGSRPVFFTGIATVVTKLLNQVRPDMAFFGEKDFQQLAVIKRLARDLDIPTHIHGCPIMREQDGLAMSSRNTYLSATERALAPKLYETLNKIRDELIQGQEITAALASGRETLTELGFAVDYLELRATNDLKPATDDTRHQARLFAAAMLGKTRLIDNISV